MVSDTVSDGSDASGDTDGRGDSRGLEQAVDSSHEERPDRDPLSLWIWPALGVGVVAFSGQAFGVYGAAATFALVIALACTRLAFVARPHNGALFASSVGVLIGLATLVLLWQYPNFVPGSGSDSTPSPSSSPVAPSSAMASPSPSPT